MLRVMLRREFGLCSFELFRLHCDSQNKLKGPPAPILNKINAISRAILKPVYWFGIPNSEPQTLKCVYFWCTLSSPFVVASYESDVLSYVECKMAKFFWGFVPEPPPPPPNKLLDMALQVVVTFLERSIDNVLLKMS